ncbi:ATPase, T2SS/T4P/T4SS family [Streptomyces sp. SGAir0957]
MAADLLRSGMASPSLDRFLDACVHTRQTILVTGAAGAGKTTVLSALARHIPSHHRVVTLETKRELRLAEDTSGDRPSVVDLYGPDSNMEQMFAAALRQSAHRLLLGDITTATFAPWMRAAASCAGSMATLRTQGSDPDGALSTFLQLAEDSESVFSTRLASAMTATSIDLIVHVTSTGHPGDGKRRHFISHVSEIENVSGMPVLTPVFAPSREDPRAVFQIYPTFMSELTRSGRTQRTDLVDPGQGWPTPWSGDTPA